MPATYVTVSNRTNGVVSIDADSIRFTLGAQPNTTSAHVLYMKDLIGASNLGAALGALITSGKIYVSLDGEFLSAGQLSYLGYGLPPEKERVGTIEAVNLKDAGTTDYTVTLAGPPSARFVPTRYYFLCTAAAALAGDATVDLGYTAGATELLNAEVMTALTDVNEVLRVDHAVTAFATVAGNATLHLQVSGADTGTSGTMIVYIEGIYL